MVTLLSAPAEEKSIKIIGASKVSSPTKRIRVFKPLLLSPFKSHSIVSYQIFLCGFLKNPFKCALQIE